MGKTDTIRQRRVDVWTPSLEAKQRWKQAAEEQGLSLSKMIIQLVEQALAENKGDLASDNDALRERIVDLEEELTRQQHRIEELDVLRGRLEDELEAYRAEETLGPGGVKKLDPRLIRILSEARDRIGRARVVEDDELVTRMRVGDDVDRRKALTKQLEALELHEVIRRTEKGWVWIDQ